jgi:hypothetical protein
MVYEFEFFLNLSRKIDEELIEDDSQTFERGWECKHYG